MKKVIGMMAVALLLTGCAFGGKSPVGVGLITDVKGHDYIVKSDVQARKSGEACAQNILGIYVAGDASLDAAKKNGGISKVANVDTSTKGIIPFFFTGCTIVYGE